MQNQKSYLQEVRRRNHPWMNDAQFECFSLMADLLNDYKPMKIVWPRGENGILVSRIVGGWGAVASHSRIDSNDLLTCAVVWAHDRSIRMKILPEIDGSLSFLLEKLSPADRVCPDLERAIERARWVAKNCYSVSI